MTDIRAARAAGLNYGDCFNRALSVWSGGPLLYKGGDFAEPISYRSVDNAEEAPIRETI